MSIADQAQATARSPDGQAWWVVCFCAQWCGVCREFRAAFDALARERPQLHLAWVDVEDEEDVVGDLDVETFPTVLVAGGGLARFFGPVLPQAGVLGRLIDSLQADVHDSRAAAQEAQALLERVLSSR